MALIANAIRPIATSDAALTANGWPVAIIGAATDIDNVRALVVSCVEALRAGATARQTLHILGTRLGSVEAWTSRAFSAYAANGMAAILATLALTVRQFHSGTNEPLGTMVHSVVGDVAMMLVGSGNAGAALAMPATTPNAVFGSRFGNNARQDGAGASLHYMVQRSGTTQTETIKEVALQVPGRRQQVTVLGKLRFDTYLSRHLVFFGLLQRLTVFKIFKDMTAHTGVIARGSALGDPALLEYPVNEAWSERAHQADTPHTRFRAEDERI